METVPLKEAQSMVGTIGELVNNAVALNRRIKFKEQKIELMEKLIAAWNKELDAYRVWISNGKFNVHPVNEAIKNRQIAQVNYQRKLQEEQLEGF